MVAGFALSWQWDLWVRLGPVKFAFGREKAKHSFLILMALTFRTWSLIPTVWSALLIWASTNFVNLAAQPVKLNKEKVWSVRRKMNMEIYVYTIKQLLALDWIVFFWKNIKTFIEKVNSGCYSNLKKYLFNVFNKELLVIFITVFNLPA